MTKNSKNYLTFALSRLGNFPKILPQLTKESLQPYQKASKSRKPGVKNQRYGCHAKSRLSRPVGKINATSKMKGE